MKPPPSVPRRVTPRRDELFSLRQTLKTQPIVFQTLPTTVFDAEYAYDLADGELKIHIYLRPQLSLRSLWETLAESFGPENLKWTREIPYRFRDGVTVQGSVFIGLKVGFDRMHHALARLVEIDRRLLYSSRV